MNERPRISSTGSTDWGEVLQDNEKWMRTVIATRSGEPQAVDEIMQEVCVAVVKQQAPLNDPSKLGPWLYQIAVRQSLMYRRKHGRRRNLEHRYADRVGRSDRSGTPEDPLDWLISAERDALIRRGVQCLNPKEAEILMLKYAQDWSYQQIAQHLGITPAAVESRLHRARRQLRRKLVALKVVEAK